MIRAAAAPTKTQLSEAFDRLQGWLEANDYRGYEPFDGLSGWLRPLGLVKPARQALVQLGVRSRWNLRPLLGIRPATASKAMGLLARAYIDRWLATHDPRWRDLADRCLAWLMAHRNTTHPGMSWGNHFDYQTRGYYLARGEPTVVWTALIGHAFMDGYAHLGDARYLEVSRQAAVFIRDGLERRPAGEGICISYVPTTFLAVHNANALAAGLLARVAAVNDADDLAELARAALAYTVGCQRPDGSWWYGEESRYFWVDNWHTAYVLDSLWWYREATGDDRFLEAFERGKRYWVSHFFDPDGAPRFYPAQPYPYDIQSAGQAIESLARYGRDEPDLVERAVRVAEWTIANMQDPSGYFYYRRGRGWVNRTPMLHWGQSTVACGLALLLRMLSRAD